MNLFLRLHIAVIACFIILVIISHVLRSCPCFILGLGLLWTWLGTATIYPSPCAQPSLSCSNSYWRGQTWNSYGPNIQYSHDPIWQQLIQFNLSTWRRKLIFSWDTFYINSDIAHDLQAANIPAFFQVHVEKDFQQH